jgi:hypothetical protein
MATIRREFCVPTDPSSVWETVSDVGHVHTRLAPGFVLATEVNGDVRRVSFANGVVATERIVTIDDDARRLVYTVIADWVVHHSASFEVLEHTHEDGVVGSRVVWTTDLLPDDRTPMMAAMVEAGVEAMRAGLAALPSDAR